MAIAATYENHEAANIFPLDDEHMDELAADIKAHGLREPIHIFEDRILDGRRRWMACRIAGVKPTTVEVETDDPVAYVISLNLHRRHLSVSQQSMVAGRARKFYDEAAKERQKSAGGDHSKALMANLPQALGTARDLAGKAVGVSGKSVEYSTAVLTKGTPALIAAVDSDKIAVSTAARMTALAPDAQDQFVANARGNRKKTRTIKRVEPDPKPGEIKSLGKGIRYANEAINCLQKIPKNDALRKQGFQLVMRFCKSHM